MKKYQIIEEAINEMWRKFLKIYRPYRKQNEKIIKKNKKDYWWV